MMRTSSVSEPESACERAWPVNASMRSFRIKGFPFIMKGCVYISIIKGFPFRIKGFPFSIKASSTSVPAALAHRASQ